MKKYYQLTKIGNSLFATISSKLVRQLNLQPGDKVFYEIIPGKKKIVMNIVSQSKQTANVVGELSKKDQDWLKKQAGSLTVGSKSTS